MREVAASKSEASFGFSMHRRSDNSDPCASTHAIISVGNQTFTPQSLKRAECSCAQSALFPFGEGTFWILWHWGLIHTDSSGKKSNKKKKSVLHHSSSPEWAHAILSFTTYTAAHTKDSVSVWARRFSSPHACHSVVKASFYTQKWCPSHCLS